MDTIVSYRTCYTCSEARFLTNGRQSARVCGLNNRTIKLPRGRHYPEWCELYDGTRKVVVIRK
jgi:hypothetical protein